MSCLREGTYTPATMGGTDKHVYTLELDVKQRYCFGRTLVMTVKSSFPAWCFGTGVCLILSCCIYSSLFKFITRKERPVCPVDSRPWKTFLGVPQILYSAAYLLPDPAFQNLKFDTESEIMDEMVIQSIRNVLVFIYVKSRGLEHRQFL